MTAAKAWASRCEQCGQRFLNRTALLVHQRAHQRAELLNANPQPTAIDAPDGKVTVSVAVIAQAISALGHAHATAIAAGAHHAVTPIAEALGGLVYEVGQHLSSTPVEKS